MEIETTEEDISKRHKRERMELQAKIQSMKKSVPKGDKKNKKKLTEDIIRLEQELDARQSQELQHTKSNHRDGPEVEQMGDAALENGDAVFNDDDDPSSEQPRLSRASKRRQKKAQEEKDREKRIAEQCERNREGPRAVELNAIKEYLSKSQLQLFNIPADGNCLYCAVNHQLEIQGKETFTVNKLRKLTAEFMRQNKDEFIPFMYNESDELVSEEYFEDYCKEVANTKLWGGQLELRALSNILTCPIKVIQASGPPTIQGEQYKGPELVLTYHRHLYRLGEHYNSTTSAAQSEDE